MSTTVADTKPRTRTPRIQAPSVTARIQALHALARDVHTGGPAARSRTVLAGVAHPDLAPADLRGTIVRLGVALHRQEHSVDRQQAVATVRRLTWQLLHPPGAVPDPFAIAEPAVPLELVHAQRAAEVG